MCLAAKFSLYQLYDNITYKSSEFTLHQQLSCISSLLHAWLYSVVGSILPQFFYIMLYVMLVGSLWQSISFLENTRKADLWKDQ